MTDADRMLELRSQGFYCSQVLMAMALDLQGRDDPAMMRAMEGLAGGLGFTGEGTCGTLTAGAAVLGLYAGRGRESDDRDPTLFFMVEDLVKWFRDGYGAEYGGLRCNEILATDPNAQVTRCPLMVAGTLQRIKEILVKNGFDLAGSPDADD
jgi:hypothetical protein